MELGVQLLNNSTFFEADAGILFGGLVFEGQNNFSETVEQLPNVSIIQFFCTIYLNCFKSILITSPLILLCLVMRIVVK